MPWGGGGEVDEALTAWNILEFNPDSHKRGATQGHAGLHGDLYTFI